MLFSKESSEEAIRKWLKVVIRKQLPLQGGVSGARVNIIEAEIHFPALEHKFKPKKIRFVIKFSTKEGFEVEKDKFERLLPEGLKRWFVNFAAPRVLVGERFFMIMPHLEDYQTLGYIVYHENENEIRSSLGITLNVLKEFNFYDHATRKIGEEKENIGKLVGLYLFDIQRSVEKIFSMDSDVRLFFTKARNEIITVNDEEIYPYPIYYDGLVKILSKVSPPFSTWSHGDCHSRNIMIKSAESDLKFIDIDKLNPNGDYIYDFGTLIADLEVYNALLQSRRPNFEFERLSDVKFSYKISSSHNVDMAVKLLKENIKEIADEKADVGWERRLHLSKARYLLDMAPRTKDLEKAFVAYCEGMKSLNALSQSQK